MEFSMTLYVCLQGGWAGFAGPWLPQLLIGTVCSISAPGPKEVTHPVSSEVSPAGQRAGPGTQLPSSVPREACETWIG